MKFELKNKVALVTGGSQGIGLACIESLAFEGCNIGMLARNEENLKEKCSYISEKYKVDCLPIKGDVSDPDIPDFAIKIMKKKFSRLDILVNNSGGPPLGSFINYNDNDWDQAINLNLMSVIRFTKFAYPVMKENNFGRIINILSLLAKEPSAPMVLSATARAGVIAYTKSVSYEMAPYGITINSICPGGVLTNRFKNLLNERAQQLKVDTKDFYIERASTVPLGRFAKPKEIGDIAAFLASEKSSYITGTSINADGGQGKST
jgi:3-oxoacyl-[acyl-carrier protein] reductase